jgi:hypothetical protein
VGGGNRGKSSSNSKDRIFSSLLFLLGVMSSGPWLLSIHEDLRSSRIDTFRSCTQVVVCDISRSVRSRMFCTDK